MNEITTLPRDYILIVEASGGKAEYESSISYDTEAMYQDTAFANHIFYKTYVGDNVAGFFEHGRLTLHFEESFPWNDSATNGNVNNNNLGTICLKTKISLLRKTDGKIVELSFNKQRGTFYLPTEHENACINDGVISGDHHLKVNDPTLFQLLIGDNVPGDSEATVGLTLEISLIHENEEYGGGIITDYSFPVVGFRTCLMKEMGTFSEGLDSNYVWPHGLRFQHFLEKMQCWENDYKDKAAWRSLTGDRKTFL